MNSREPVGSKSDFASLRSSVSSTRQNSFQSKDNQKPGVGRELSPRVNLLGSGRDFKIYTPLRQEKRETSPLSSRRNSCAQKQISPIRSIESLISRQPSKTQDLTSSKGTRKSYTKPASPINNKPDIKKLDLNLLEKRQPSPKPLHKVAETEPSPRKNHIQKSNSTQFDKSKIVRDKSPGTRAKVIPRDKSPNLRDKSPNLRDKSPNLRDKSPIKPPPKVEARPKSPINRTKSPSNLVKTVSSRAKSPVNSVKRSGGVSPTNYTKSPVNKVKSPTCATKARTVAKTTTSMSRTASKMKPTESDASPPSKSIARKASSPMLPTTSRNILTSSQEISPKILSKSGKIKDKIRAEARVLQAINSNSQSKNFARTVAKVLQRYIKRNIQASFANIYSEQQFRWEYEQMKLRDFSKIHKKTLFNGWYNWLKQKKEKQLNKEEMAARHYNLQLIINAFSNWIDFYQNRKLKPEDRSKIEEIDSILMSFNLPSIANDTNVSDNSRLYDESPLRLNISHIRQEISYTEEPDRKGNILSISPLATPKRKYSLGCFDNTAVSSTQKEEAFKPRVKPGRSSSSLSETHETDPLEDLAILHHEKALMVLYIQYFYGLHPWKLAIINKKLQQNHDQKVAIDFYNTKLLQKAVHGWLEFYVISYSNQEVPHNHYKKQLFRKAIRSWKDFTAASIESRSDPYGEIIRTFRLVSSTQTFLAPVILDKWRQFVSTSKRERARVTNASPRKMPVGSKKK